MVSSSSSVYSKLVENKICTYDIDYGYENLEKYIIVRIGTYTEKIEDIENQNFDDYKNVIDNLDFSNYCITKMIKRDKVKNES